MTVWSLRISSCATDTHEPSPSLVTLVTPSDEACTHIELLTISRDVRRAAIESDVDQLHLALCRLRNALVTHVRAESPEVAALHAVSRDVVIAGQRRLVRLIDDLLSVADTGEAGCPCMRRSVELTKLLVRQARLESGLASRRSL